MPVPGVFWVGFHSSGEEPEAGTALQSELGGAKCLVLPTAHLFLFFLFFFFLHLLNWIDHSGLYDKSSFQSGLSKRRNCLSHRLPGLDIGPSPNRWGEKGNLVLLSEERRMHTTDPSVAALGLATQGPWHVTISHGHLTEREEGLSYIWVMIGELKAPGAGQCGERERVRPRYNSPLPKTG
jgi:hypothetical protein